MSYETLTADKAEGAEDIDTACRTALGYPMGPFEQAAAPSGGAADGRPRPYSAPSPGDE